MNKNIVFLLILFVYSLGISKAFAENYSRLYDEAKPADFQLVHEIDPFQNEDYQNYAWSPFPLFRLSSDVYFKGQTIPAGYYILTPRNINGRDYVLFKEAGKVKYIIPVAKTELVPIDFYHTNLPEPKRTKWQNFCKATSEKFYTVFKKTSQKAPPPSSYIVTDFVDDDMYLIVLYYGEQKYNLVFKSKKD